MLRQLWMILVVWGSAGLVGCFDRPLETPKFDSESHWMRGCQADAECGEDLACLCGVCALPCDEGACGGLEDAVCAPIDACAVEAPLCLPACVADPDCPVGLACIDGACMPPPPPPGPRPREEQVCDGADDDGDGQIDEGLDGDVCFAGEGLCRRPGITVCGPDGLVCDAEPGVPGREVCNGLDDNCDGVVDEGLDCEIEPVVDVGPQPVFQGDNVLFDASRSRSPGGIVDYRWTIEDGPDVQQLVLDAPRMNYAIGHDGLLRGTLTLTDFAGNQASTAFQLRVGDVDAIIDVQALEPAPAGEESTIRFRCLNLATEPVVAIAVEFPGEAPRAVPFEAERWHEVHVVRHTFPAPGRYAVGITCEDIDSTITEIIEVDVPAR